MKECTLVDRIKNKEESAFKELVETYQTMVISTCYGILQDYTEAEDIAQDVFVEVYQSIHKFRGESKLSTWLYSIAMNKSINATKKNRFRKLLTKIEEAFEGYDSKQFETTNDLHSKPEQKLESKENTAIIKSAINSLPKNQKIAFTLHKYEDLSHKKICDIMNLSLSSVENLIYRAKISLKKRPIKILLR